MLLFFLLNHSYFFILIMVFMLFSGLFTFLYPRVPAVFTVAFFAAVSFCYVYIYDLFYFLLPIVMGTSLFIAIPIILVKYNYYLQQTAHHLEIQ